jgi:hypothetical protein
MCAAPDRELPSIDCRVHTHPNDSNDPRSFRRGSRNTNRDFGAWRVSNGNELVQEVVLAHEHVVLVQPGQRVLLPRVPLLKPFPPRCNVAARPAYRQQSHQPMRGGHSPGLQTPIPECIES